MSRMLLSAGPRDEMDRRARSTSRSSRSSGGRGKGSPSVSRGGHRGAHREPGPESKPRKSSRERVVKRSEPKEASKSSSVEDAGKVSSTVVNVDSVMDTEQEDMAEDSMGLLESEIPDEAFKTKTMGLCEWILAAVALIVILLSFPFSIWFCVKIVQEYERAVIFRMGHLLPGKPKGPGLFFYLPFLDVCKKVDIRIKMFEIPTHKIVTKDMVTIALSAVCHYRVENVPLCFTTVAGVSSVLQLLVQTTMKDILAHHNFSDILLDRSRIAQEIKVALDAVTCQWGIKVERAEIDDLSLPAELQHTIAAEAEAKRQAQLKLIAAEGERAACEALKMSAEILSSSPAALHLRYLQILRSLSAEKTTLILPLPSDLLDQVSPANHSTLLDSAGAQRLTVDQSKTEPQENSPML
ncbi:podocin isoform X2 [Amia ocellicauda]|uniref:podocin isoform X2 n=1 Tax=Amia ocellicauda TaxID=2972642 RepID=UPI003463B157